jgi:hypothetical protein
MPLLRIVIGAIHPIRGRLARAAAGPSKELHEPRHLLDAEEVLADRLQVADAALSVLGDGVGVAEPALERVALEEPESS